VIGIFGAALGGAAVGVERQWSGHASGQGAHFAGVRTFTLLGGLAGLTGWLWSAGYEAPAGVLLASAGLLVVAAYAAASRRDVEGTTEVAALVVLAAGVTAGTGHVTLASGVIAITWLLLVEKSRLHAMVAQLDDAEMRAGARFAVMAVVILPLLPEGPFGPLGGVRPRELWALVLLFSGLSFAGYVGRRAVGVRGGYLVAGLLGGFVSSTGVTLTFAQKSRGDEALGPPLAAGVTAACTVMFVRVVVATAILNPPLVPLLVPYVWLPLLVGIAGSLIGARVHASGPISATQENPLQFKGAMQMALLFQGVLFAVNAIREAAGDVGILASGAVLGAGDVDALTIAMSRSAASGTPLAVAAQALALGMLANTILKLILALGIGRGRFRRIVAASLTAQAIASAAALALARWQ
jgi:uncharacterized membrane protein (DUF4010 family)